VGGVAVEPEPGPQRRQDWRRYAKGSVGNVTAVRDGERKSTRWLSFFHLD